MDAFDRIFGYDAIKKELRRTADALNCPVVYELIGVTAPKGLLLHGEPGVGKTMMARALIEASGRTAWGRKALTSRNADESVRESVVPASSRFTVRRMPVCGLLFLLNQIAVCYNTDSKMRKRKVKRTKEL